MDCSIEREATPGGVVLTVRRDDGGFRRLLATPDGRGLTTADGALPARISVVGQSIDVRIGDDRFRLPVSALRMP